MTASGWRAAGGVLVALVLAVGCGGPAPRGGEAPRGRDWRFTAAGGVFHHGWAEGAEDGEAADYFAGFRGGSSSIRTWKGDWEPPPLFTGLAPARPAPAVGAEPDNAPLLKERPELRQAPFRSLWQTP